MGQFRMHHEIVMVFMHAAFNHTYHIRVTSLLSIVNIICIIL
jgi:hypothetical protein